MTSTAVIGLGETGKPLFDVLASTYNTIGVDLKLDKPTKQKMDFINVCLPWSKDFVSIVKEYQEFFEPSLTIIHSTVPIGTTKQIPQAVHSPILGMHNNMLESIRKFTKWVGGEYIYAKSAELYLGVAGIMCRTVDSSDFTEALKLRCLSKYGMSIAFAQYEKELCESIGMDYDLIMEWDLNYNKNVDYKYHRPVLTPPGKMIGGHCVIPGTRILQSQYPNRILEEVLKYDGKKDYKAWQPTNIYPTAKIGKDVNIGTFCEIGNNVVIGDRVRIGAMTFIPEGVIIEDDAWIGPRVTFSNDRYPPSGRDRWKTTVIKKYARLGAAVCVLPGVTVGENSLVGMGSVITRDIPAGETWAGVPARKMDA
jgi:UDP-2-acetamido-3-amino-2,3-dideoxy-glucuronate N-acetyltransferase